jgi:hypothetical protein
LLIELKENTLSYQKYTPEVRRWNEVMLNAPSFDHSRDVRDTMNIAKIGRQSNFVIEEAKEIREGFETTNVQEMLDGHLDTRFVNDQIGVYLEALGIDLEAAWNEVCASNNSKFSTDLDMMLKSAKSLTEELGDEVLVQQAPSAVGEPTTYILKRTSNGKIMKPDCFREPNLRPFIPKHLRGKR